MDGAAIGTDRRGVGCDSSQLLREYHRGVVVESAAHALSREESRWVTKAPAVFVEVGESNSGWREERRVTPDERPPTVLICFADAEYRVQWIDRKGKIVHEDRLLYSPTERQAL